MAWVTPPVFTSGAGLTAAQLNILSGDLNETAPAKSTGVGRIFVGTAVNAIAARQIIAGIPVVAAETTVSTTYTDLATVGAFCSGVTTGPGAIVVMSGKIQNNTASGNSFMSYAITGATTLAASDDLAIGYAPTTAAGSWVMASGLFFLDPFTSDITAGSNTFTAKYRVNAGTGTFAERKMFVIPL